MVKSDTSRCGQGCEATRLSEHSHAIGESITWYDICYEDKHMFRPRSSTPMRMHIPFINVCTEAPRQAQGQSQQQFLATQNVHEYVEITQMYINNRVDKLWSIHPMEYHIEKKKKTKKEK